MNDPKPLWPFSFKVRRCRANWITKNGIIIHPVKDEDYENTEITYCNKLFWPWQKLAYEYDFECPQIYHHECHHKETWSLMGDKMNNYLTCEHGRD